MAQDDIEMGVDAEDELDNQAPPLLAFGSDRFGPASKALVVPHRRIVGIEHPCIIKDIHKAVKLLGGENRIEKILEKGGVAATSLRPDDPFAKKLVSQRTEVDHVLLRIVLPRKTGRKRKRGTEGPFQYDSELSKAPNGHADRSTPNNMPENAPSLPLKADELLERLSDTRHAYTLQPVGSIENSLHFRSLPDFQLVSQDSPLSHSMATSLLSLDLPKIKTFNPDMSVTANPMHISGPPRFTPYNQPLNYGYAQNRVATVDDTGHLHGSNTLGRKRPQQAIRFDESCPTRPAADLPGLSSRPKYLREAVKAVKCLFDTHKVITRRAALNLLPDVSDLQFKEATQYVGYAFKSGPWRDCLVIHGLDPRTDPSLRAAQTLAFQLEGRNGKFATGRYKRPEFRGIRDSGIDPTGKKGKRESKDHIFDGVPGVNKTFQIRDIVHPTLKKLFEEAAVTDECDEQNGWYGNGVICVARTIMKDMISTNQKGEDFSEWNEAYEIVARKVPEVVTDENMDSVALDPSQLRLEGVGVEQASKACELVHAARMIIRQGAVGRKGRASMGKLSGSLKPESKVTTESVVDDLEQGEDQESVITDDAEGVDEEDDGGVEDHES